MNSHNSQPELSMDNQYILEKAKFSDRFFAIIVDFIIVAIIIKGFQVFTTYFFPNLYRHTYLVLFIMLLIVLTYFAVYAYKNNGQTIGKKWNELKIVGVSGQPLSLGRLLIRELIARGPAVFTLVSLFGFYPNPWYLTYLLALTKEKKALHDIIAKTQVVKL